MKKISLLFMLLFPFYALLQAQGGWIKEYDGAGSTHTSKVYQTVDRGYILITDGELIKVDWKGQKSWSRELSRGAEVVLVKGGYRVLDGLSVRFFNLKGKEIRTVNLQAPPDSAKGFIRTEDFELTPDGGYFVIGNTNTVDEYYDQSYPREDQRQEGLLARYNSSGGLIAYSFFTPNDSSSAFFRHLLPADDGGYIIWGATAETREFNPTKKIADSISALIVKASAQAAVTWFNLLFNVERYNFTVTDIRKTYDNAYLTVVRKSEYNGSVVAKLNTLGKVIWQANRTEDYSTLTVNRDNSFVLINSYRIGGDEQGGYRYSIAGVTKFKNTLQNELWYNEVTVNDEYMYFLATHVISTNEGGYIVAGMQFGEGTIPTLIKLDKNGDIYSSYISGQVYKDSLKNCVFESDDTPVKRALIRAVSGNKRFAGYSDSLGYYRLKVDTGNYTVSVSAQTSLYELLVCPATNTYQVNIPNPGTSITDKDFVYGYSPGVRDLTVYLSGGFFPRGRTGSYYISYRNSGTQVESGTVKLTFNPLLTFLYSSPDTPVASSSGQITWSYANLQPGETRSIYAAFNVSSTLLEGTLLKATANILPITSDKNPADNTATAENRVGASSDPNAKFVNPAGIGEAGLIKPNTDLLYTVQFQNVGTDTAFFVQIADTLDETLDISTLRLLGSSHPYSINVDNPNVLTFTFDDVVLPDSITNLPASQGFLQYAITPYKNAAIGAIITNTAHIYFDYNEAVVTNTTINVISDGTSHIAFAKQNADLIYPNPAFDKVQISFKEAINGQINILSITGQLIQEERVSGNRASFNVEQLPAGLYLLEVKAEGVYRTSKFIVQH